MALIEVTQFRLATELDFKPLKTLIFFEVFSKGSGFRGLLNIPTVVVRIVKRIHKNNAVNLKILTSGSDADFYEMCSVLSCVHRYVVDAGHVVAFGFDKPAATKQKGLRG
ncbi:hypothetical protein [Martelella mangrovi]|uniref:STAS domain-containing protein n=1 Tax=Martelella mangrovi TaxID=1397477 RepID=A0ABV2I6M2_9HYPH